MKVAVLDVPQKMGKKGTLVQPIALYYPSKRLPVEDVMFINSEAEALPVGDYNIDVEKCLEPDASNRNKPMLWIRPKNMVSAVKATIGAMTSEARRTAV